MELFSVTCTTCHARLKVRDAAAVGQILACPKCGSMVQVLAPADWQPPGLPDTLPVTPEPMPAASAPLPPPVKTRLPKWRDDPSTEGFDYGDPESQARLEAAWRNRVAAGSPAIAPAAATAVRHVSWVRWALLAGVPAALLSALLCWTWFRPVPPAVRPHAKNDAKSVVVRRLPQPAGDVPAPALPKPAPDAAATPEQLIPWVPRDAQVVVSVRWNELDQQPMLHNALAPRALFWNQATMQLLSAFRLSPGQVSRLQWSASDLSSLSSGAQSVDEALRGGVVMIELAEPLAEPARLLEASQPLDWKLGQRVCHRPPPGWPNPFAIWDERTIVTGPRELLESLSERGKDAAPATALEEALARLDARDHLLVVLDMSALRDAGALPEWLPLLELWRASRDDWQTVGGLPLAVALALRSSSDARAAVLAGKLHLVCDGSSAARQVHAALEQMLSAAENTAAGESQRLTEHLLAGELNVATAAQVKLLLNALTHTLGERESGVDEAVAWARIGWSGNLAGLAEAAFASLPALERRRLELARPIDEENHRRLLKAIAAYERAEQGFPAGAAGSRLLPPERRLSWIASLLPYYGQLDWHGELNFGRPWNDRVNQRVTRRILSGLVNPAIGPQSTEAGFPVTHYVAIAGVGAHAGLLEADNPRAGVFGYHRRASIDMIRDGASNTIALAGVSGRPGPWAAGGEATVRAFTRRPYINGPDGFGSGRPDGMLVGMADGSVRFLSNQIDPEVLEHLATINGGEPVDLASGDPRHRSADPKVREPVAAAVADPAPEPAEPPAADEPPVEPRTPRVDVADRLADRLPGIRLDRVPLSDALDLLSQLSTVPISLDLEALLEAGIRPDEPVSVHMTDTTIGEALEALLAEQGLGYVVLNGQVLVTTPERERQTLETANYAIGDLARVEAEAQALADLVRRLVEPSSWKQVGGPAAIDVGPDGFEIRQTRLAHRQIAEFLDKLRLARGLPVHSPSARKPTLETRFARARQKLASPVTANFREATPLARVLDHLQSSTGVHLLLDGAALAAEGLNGQLEVKLIAHDQPLSDALEALLAPPRLAVRIAGERTLVVTTQAALRDRLELEFHPVRDLVGGTSPGDLVERIKSQVEPDRWDDAGGSAAIYFDAPSSVLLVLAPPRLQIELEEQLAGWRSAAAADQEQSDSP